MASPIDRLAQRNKELEEIAKATGAIPSDSSSPTPQKPPSTPQPQPDQSRSTSVTRRRDDTPEVYAAPREHRQVILETMDWLIDLGMGRREAAIESRRLYEAGELHVKPTAQIRADLDRQQGRTTPTEKPKDDSQPSGPIFTKAEDGPDLRPFKPGQSPEAKAHAKRQEEARQATQQRTDQGTTKATQSTAISREKLKEIDQGKLDQASAKLGLGTKAAEAILTKPDATLTPHMRRAREALQKDLGIVPVDPTIVSRAKDTLKEALSFGSAETATFNRDDLEKRYEQTRTKLTQQYDEAQKKAQSEGKELVESKEEFLSQLPSKDQFVQNTLKEQASFAELGKEIGLNSIPLYGTIRTWEDSPNWARGLSVASDLLFVIPVVGGLSTAARAGTSVPRAAAQLAVAEVKAPITSVIHPIRTVKQAAAAFEPYVHPKRIPTAGVEIRQSTVRLKPDDLPEGTPKTTAPMTAEEIAKLPKAAREALERRDVVTKRAIMGDKPVVDVGGKRVELTGTALQKVASPVAVHTAPDVRPFLSGLEIKAGREGGLFVAPTSHTRFTRSSAFGDVPTDPMPGAVLIRDQGVLSKLKPSNKFYRGTTEIEMIVPPDTKLPKPSQTLFTRNAQGDRVALVVIGKPFSKSEIAKMKFVGGVDTVKDIFRPASRTGKTPFDEAVEIAHEAKALRQQADRISDAAERARLIKKADELDFESFRRIEDLRLDRVGTSSPSLRLASVYYGEQDISRGLEALESGRTTSRTRTSDQRKVTTDDRRKKTTDNDRKPTESDDRRQKQTDDDRRKFDSKERREPPSDDDDRRPTEDGGDRTPPPDDGGRTPPPDDGDRTPPPDDDRRRTPPPDDPTRTPPPKVRREPPTRSRTRVSEDEEKSKIRDVSKQDRNLPVNVVAFRQGAFWYVKDLTTGEQTIMDDPPAGLPDTGTPKESLTILERGPKRPTQRSIDMGAVQATLGRRGRTIKHKGVL